MAKSEPNKLDETKTTPKNEQTTPVSEAPAPEMSTVEAATLTQEGESALREIGEEHLEPSTRFDFSGKHILEPGDVVVTSDKINEIILEKQKAVREAEQTAAPEKPDKAPNKTGTSRKSRSAGSAGGRGRGYSEGTGGTASRG